MKETTEVVEKPLPSYKSTINIIMFSAIIVFSAALHFKEDGQQRYER
jgi:hypothetical protein